MPFGWEMKGNAADQIVRWAAPVRNNKMRCLRVECGVASEPRSGLRTNRHSNRVKLKGRQPGILCKTQTPVGAHTMYGPQCSARQYRYNCSSSTTAAGL